ncbi:hypothetical protein GOP47_0006116 [Adiantum capillus-veneris]|uniref:Uncharacterized protein n=1 Tax=Adiantum capillus-veneris TaxID=13818 RepID=A0A9D4ZMR1_ADICA|nr:hypothetical protein GOP47_0006116 [Adiantum capillus-veneris]
MEDIQSNYCADMAHESMSRQWACIQLHLSLPQPLGSELTCHGSTKLAILSRAAGCMSVRVYLTLAIKKGLPYCNLSTLPTLFWAVLVLCEVSWLLMAL